MPVHWLGGALLRRAHETFSDFECLSMLWIQELDFRPAAPSLQGWLHIEDFGVCTLGWLLGLGHARGAGSTVHCGTRGAFTAGPWCILFLRLFNID